MGPDPGQTPRRRDAARSRCRGPKSSTRSSNSSRANSTRPTATLKPDPGRVTARRLNRSEYTNTIRDLLAVDFRAEKNFPTDDLGNGFDNIGDVLTISPVLMEKYLSAAGEHRRARHRGRPAAQEAARDPARASRIETVRRIDSEHDRRHAPHRLRRRVHHPHRPAGRARQGRQAGQARLLDGRQAAQHHQRRNQAVGPGLLQSVLRRDDAAVHPRGRSRLPRRLHRRRLRQDADRQGHLQQQEEQVPGLDHVRRAVPVEGGEGQPQEDPDLRSEVRAGVRGQDHRQRWRAARTAAR